MLFMAATARFSAKDMYIRFTFSVALCILYACLCFSFGLLACNPPFSYVPFVMPSLVGFFLDISDVFPS